MKMQPLDFWALAGSQDFQNAIETFDSMQARFGAGAGFDSSLGGDFTECFFRFMTTGKFTGKVKTQSKSDARLYRKNCEIKTGQTTFTAAQTYATKEQAQAALATVNLVSYASLVAYMPTASVKATMDWLEGQVLQNLDMTGLYLFTKEGFMQAIRGQLVVRKVYNSDGWKICMNKLTTDQWESVKTYGVDIMEIFEATEAGKQWWRENVGAVE